MNPFTRPLVALSLSEPDVELLRYASLIAPAVAGGPPAVRFAHVVTDRTHELQESEEDSLLEQMGAEVRAHFGDGGEFSVVQGTRLDELLSLAVACEHDVILLGHRRSRSGRRSLARRLAMAAPCSVWLVPEGAPRSLDNILVPVDFSSHSRDALSVATALAAARGLTHCRAVHVFFDPSTIRYDEHVEEIVGREEAAFAEMISATDCHGVDVEAIFEESAHPTEAILRVAQRTQSDLIVMNTRGRSRAAAVLLGSVTSDTMAATRVPLLAVKHYGSRLTLLEALLNHRMWEEKAPKTN